MESLKFMKFPHICVCKPFPAVIGGMDHDLNIISSADVRPVLDIFPVIGRRTEIPGVMRTELPDGGIKQCLINMIKRIPAFIHVPAKSYRCDRIIPKDFL